MSLKHVQQCAKIFTWTYVLLVTHFIRVSKKCWILAVVSIVSASVLAVAAAKHKLLVFTEFYKKRSTIGWAFFLSVLLNVGLVRADDCSSDISSLKKQALVAIVDGDTLRLKNGKTLRVIGLNTPEIVYDGGSSELFALEARQAVRRFFTHEQFVYVKDGAFTEDKYGRRLVHVYRGDGKNLAADLLVKGLGWHIVVPPNSAFANCYAQQEAIARQARIGVWSDVYQPVDASLLRRSHAGYRVVTGRIESVVRGRNGWWLMMGKLAISVRDKDGHYFDGFNAKAWLGKSLTLKAWVIDRSESTAVTKKEFKPFLAHWRHPLMVVHQ